MDSLPSTFKSTDWKHFDCLGPVRPSRYHHGASVGWTEEAPVGGSRADQQPDGSLARWTHDVSFSRPFAADWLSCKCKFEISHSSGLDSFSCWQMIKLLKQLAQHGRTVICTIHQPSAKLFEKFDVVYVLAYGQCLYQGHSSKLVPFLHSVQMPCPKFHNPADFAIELASAEYGMDKVKTLINSIDNGENLSWFVNYNKPKQQHKHPIQDERSSSYEVSEFHQLKVLLTRCVIKAKRDQTLTHLRIAVNIIIAALLGWLFIGSGNDGSRVLDNYNLLFSILMHHMMTPMMMTILTCELGRWWRRFLINFSNSSSNGALHNPQGKL